MEVSITLLYVLIMKFFTGLEWVSSAHLPRCTAWVDKIFPDYYCLNYAHRGQLQWRIGRNRFRTLRAPVAWWTFPGPRFQYGVQNGVPWDHYFVCFRGARAESYRRNGLLPTKSNGAWSHVADPAAFVQEFAAVIGSHSDLNPPEQRRIHRLEGLLLSLAEPPAARLESIRERQLKTLVEKIRANPASLWEMAKEAGRLGYSLPHFHRLFRQYTGLPPRRFLVQTRIELAARLVHSGDLPLKAIAVMVGCPDIYYFSRLFRRRFGVPPGRYRRQAGLP